MTTPPPRPPTMNPRGRRVELAECELHAIAWRFLASEFAALVHADWPLDRRVDAYLARQQMSHVLNDGDAYDAVLQHILANIGPALRSGVLTDMTWRTSHGRRGDIPSARGPMLSPPS